MKIIKGYKIRLFLTKEQEILAWEHIHARRFVWNYMVDLQRKNHEEKKPYLSAFDMMGWLPKLKRENSWLYNVSNTSLQITCRDLHVSYQRFFKKLSKYPKFKSKKRAKFKYPVRTDVFKILDNNTVKIEKLKTVKCRIPYKQIPNGKFRNVRLEYINNKWILSFGVECESQALETNDYSTGIDLGIKELAVISYDNNRKDFHNINKTGRIKRLEHKISHVQRIIFRKYKTNGNYEKTKGIIKYENILRKLIHKRTNIRTNYIHQVTHGILDLKPRRVLMEDLDIVGLMKNRYLTKAIQDQKWYEFIRQMKYKCEWNGIEYIQVGRYYPSSRICSCCGSIKRDLKLSDRTYVCEKCGLVIDRDYNAAINLMNYKGI